MVLVQSGTTIIQFKVRKLFNSCWISHLLVLNIYVLFHNFNISIVPQSISDFCNGQMIFFPLLSLSSFWFIIWLFFFAAIYNFLSLVHLY
jgi:hypothetical protein